MTADLRRLAFVDVETTGLDPTADRIAEIGVVTVDSDGSTEWGTFVVPRRGAEARPPRGVIASLGALPATAPTFGDVARELQRRLAGRLFIAHNARFDYAFIKAEFERSGIAFETQVACTVMLSRRLYPEHPVHDLDALIDRHRVPASERHRALADARALAACWF
ncbi:MAG TPA: 3'-5' exonuclease, partial [Casimicrobiaceae bacterium]|nr:3'-5' exonuclease [Casimicrobiaceae bacterium]